MSIHRSEMNTDHPHRLTNAQRDSLRLAMVSLLLGMATYGMEAGVFGVNIRGYTDTLAAIYLGVAAMISFSLILPHRTSLFLTMAAVPFSLLIVYLLAQAIVPLHLPAFLLLIGAVIVAGRDVTQAQPVRTTSVR